MTTDETARMAWLEDQVSKGYLSCLPEFKSLLQEQGRAAVLDVVRAEYDLHRGFGQDAWERGNRDACEAILRECGADVSAIC